MKKYSVTLSLWLTAGLWAQTPGAPSVTLDVDLAPETVVASVEGAGITYGDLQAVLRALPPQAQQAALADRKRFVEQYALLRRLTEMAVKDKLDQKSPYKEALVYARMQVLWQAEINEQSQKFEIGDEDIRKFYEGNKDRYTQAHVKVLYVPFTATPPPQTDPKAKKVLNEAEAKTKIEGLLKDVRGGADFVKLIKQHSEDFTSREKEGDFPPIRKSDKLPDAIKNVIFALKPGEVSEPVRQPNGFYLFRLEQLTEEPFAKIRESIHTEIRNQRLNEWMKSTQQTIQVKVENDAFFAPKTMPLPTPAPGGAKPAPAGVAPASPAVPGAPGSPAPAPAPAKPASPK